MRTPNLPAHARRRLLGVLVSVAVVAAPAVAPVQSLGPPPPTPVPVPGGGTSPSPFPSVLRTPAPGGLETPAIDAEAALLVDLETGQRLFALDPGEKRPIASLTKIMTAYLVLSRTSPADVVTVSENAASGRIVGISTLGLAQGERITVRELLYALLLQSANDAAGALAEHVGATVERCVGMMNRAAARLGLSRTRLASPNGLDDAGYSTAGDLARLTRMALEIPEFAEVVAARSHEVPAPEGEPRVIQNRNALLWLYPGATGVKTGFTTAAGFCIVASAERDGERLLAVVLGERGEAFSDAAALLNYGFAAFERRTLLEGGTALGPVEVGGRRVDVAAGADLAGLVRVDAVVRRRVSVDPAVRYPPARGQRIGTVVVFVPGGAVGGSVPLVVTDVPPPPPLDDGGTWWSRALGALIDAGDGVVDAIFG